MQFSSSIISVPRGKSKVKKGIPKKGIPSEDYADVQGCAVPVCDGVTLIHQHPYPNPSPAAKVAKLAAKTLIDMLKQSDGNVRVLRTAFIKANRAISEYNWQIGNTPRTVDFLNRQYAATVAAFGMIADSTLFWGQINDCGIMVVNSRGHIIMNQILDQRSYRSFIAEHRRKGLSIKDTPEEHQFVRKNIVNNQEISYRGKPINWGVMTGESKAKYFLRTGRFRLKPQQTVLFYTDGMIPLLALASFRREVASVMDIKQIRQLIQSLSNRGPQFQDEKTVVVIRPVMRV